MKKIIQGRKYDTKTAKEISSYEANLSDKVSYTRETLYQKRTGEFFLFGEGGAFTQYGEKCSDGSISEGKCILPYSLEEAKEWVSCHCDVDTYESLFGEVCE